MGTFLAILSSLLGCAGFIFGVVSDYNIASLLFIAALVVGIASTFFNEEEETWHVKR